MNKHVLLFGDSNTWGYDGVHFKRYEDDERWTTLIKDELGAGYYVVAEGLSGRTTVFDDPLTESLAGIDAIAGVMMSHMPLDLLVIMLGTNDTKLRFSATAANITKGLMRLVTKAKTLPDVWRTHPRILIISPMKIDKRLYDNPVNRAGMGDGCVEKSEELPERYREAAKLLGVDYMDANPYCTPAEGDWMHIDLPSNARLAKAVAAKVKEMFEREEGMGE